MYVRRIVNGHIQKQHISLRIYNHITDEGMVSEKRGERCRKNENNNILQIKR